MCSIDHECHFMNISFSFDVFRKNLRHVFSPLTSLIKMTATRTQEHWEIRNISCTCYIICLIADLLWDNSVNRLIYLDTSAGVRKSVVCIRLYTLSSRLYLDERFGTAAFLIPVQRADSVIFWNISKRSMVLRGASLVSVCAFAFLNRLWLKGFENRSILSPRQRANFVISAVSIF